MEPAFYVNFKEGRNTMNILHTVEFYDPSVGGAGSCQ